MRVGLRVDAGPLIGGGHVMRCLTLANALADRGAEVVFVTAAMPERLQSRIRSAGHDIVAIEASPEAERSGVAWHEPPFSAEAQRRDAAQTRSALSAVDWLVVDHYLLDASWHSPARTFASKILVIDDLANRQYDCDLLLDQTFGRDAADYTPLVPRGCSVLAGSLYALLRPEFAAEREAALGRREATTSLRRVLITMGTTDPDGVSAKLARSILRLAPHCSIDVILGAQAAEQTGLPEMGNVLIHVDTDDMAPLMRDAHLAVGAAGATSWERCCLGLPSIALILAENQRAGAEAVARAGAAIALEHADEVPQHVAALTKDASRLSRMSAAAFAIVDGLGAGRVVQHMLGEATGQPGEVTLRPATEQDARILWLWRNDPLTRSRSRNHQPVTWQEHMRWLRAAPQDPQRQLFIAHLGSIPVGSIRFDASEVSISVAPEWRGQGVGRRILTLACASYSGQISAVVQTGNDASRRLFESCGFHEAESAEPGFLRFIRAAEQPKRKSA